MVSQQSDIFHRHGGRALRKRYREQMRFVFGATRLEEIRAAKLDVILVLVLFTEQKRRVFASRRPQLPHKMRHRGEREPYGNVANELLEGQNRC